VTEPTLSRGNHSAVVCGEEHLRMAVFGYEYLVLAGGSVPRLYHGITADGSQVAPRNISQRDAA